MPSNHLILCHPLLLLPSPFPASGSFLMNQFFTSGGQSIGVSALASVLPVNIQDYFPLVWAKKQVQCRKNFTENWREWEQGWALRSFLIFFLPSLPSSLPLPLSRAQIVLMATERSICSCRCLETSLVPGVGGREPSLLLGQEARRLLDGPMVWGGLCMVWFGGVCSKVAHKAYLSVGRPGALIGCLHRGTLRPSLVFVRRAWRGPCRKHMSPREGTGRASAGLPTRSRDRMLWNTHPGPAVGPPRPGPVPVPPRLGSLIPRGRYSAQEGSAQSDAWRDDAGRWAATVGRRREVAPCPGAQAPSGLTRRPRWLPGSSLGSRSPSAPIKTELQSQSQTQESFDSGN